MLESGRFICEGNHDIGEYRRRAAAMIRISTNPGKMTESYISDKKESAPNFQPNDRSDESLRILALTEKRRSAETCKIYIELESNISFSLQASIEYLGHYDE